MTSIKITFYYVFKILLVIFALCFTVKPMIHDFKNVVLKEGDTLAWDCLSYGDPAPEMTFRRAGLTTDYITGNNVRR